jgi:DNA-binding XRE family transcriptional regulator
MDAPERRLGAGNSGVSRGRRRLSDRHVRGKACRAPHYEERPRQDPATGTPRTVGPVGPRGDLPEGTGGRGAGAMSSYTKWDRAAYIERVGGQEEAERRRKALMASQSGHRLAEERKRHGLTQAQLAEAMGVTPGRVSQIERGELSTIDAVARYVEALGGRLDLIASFGDHTLTVATTGAA